MEIEFQIECKLMDKKSIKIELYFIVSVMCDTNATEINIRTVHKTELIFFSKRQSPSHYVYELKQHTYLYMIE